MPLIMVVNFLHVLCDSRNKLLSVYFVLAGDKDISSWKNLLFFFVHFNLCHSRLDRKRAISLRKFCGNGLLETG